MKNMEIVLYDEVGILPFKRYLLEHIDDEKVKIVPMPSIIRTTFKEYEILNNQSFFYKLEEFGDRATEFKKEKQILIPTVEDNVFELETREFNFNSSRDDSKVKKYAMTKKYYGK